MYLGTFSGNVRGYTKTEFKPYGIVVLSWSIQKSSLVRS